MSYHILSCPINKILHLFLSYQFPCQNFLFQIQNRNNMDLPFCHTGDAPHWSTVAIHTAIGAFTSEKYAVNIVL